MQCSKTLIFALTLLCLPASTAYGGKIIHEVLPGDTLVEIAKRYRIKPRDIRRRNKIKGSHLRIGRKLRITTAFPARTRHRVKVTVRKGDSPSRIARKHKMKVSLFKRLNAKIKKPLRIGQKVWVIKEGPKIKPGKGKHSFTRFESYSGFKVLNSKRAWGTLFTIDRLSEVLFAHHLRYPKKHPILVGDLSSRGGGFLPPHRSHRRGRDVDIRFPLKKQTKHYVKATRSNLDLPRTWDLINAFVKTKDVVYIFVDYRLQKILYKYAVEEKKISKKRLSELFQYPRSRKAKYGILRHEPGHAAHFHVRFRRERKPTEPNS